MAYPRHNPWVIALTVTMATFMEVLDTSIANVALPHIAGNLSATPDEATWVLTSYLVSNAIVLPLSAWLSGIMGRKKFYMTCVALFAASSFLCGLAPSLSMLVFFRILQGAGGGGLQPSEQAILADTFSQKQRGMAFAIYGVAVVSAPALGPTLGGWITDNYSWRWIFFINIPVGIISLIMTGLLVQDPPKEKRKQETKRRIDFIGLGFIALGLGCLQIVLDKGQEDDWFGSTFICIFAALCVLGLIGMIFWELFTKDPIVDLRLLKERNFAAAFLLMFTFGFGLLGSTVLIPLFAQQLLGYTATIAGEALSFGALGIMVLMPIVGLLLGKVQGKWVIGFGMLLCAAGLYRMTNWDTDVDFWTIALDRLLQACGLAFLFVPVNTIAYAFVPKNKTNDASGLINLARNVGGSIGISVGATMLARRAQVHQNYLIAHATPFDMAYRHAITGAMSIAHHIAVAPSDAARRAAMMIYGTINQQANMLAVLDAMRLFAGAFVIGMPLILLLRKMDPAKAHAGGH
jgi:MFS transporter, DHA2 family, multidrug resistance protein